MSRRRPARERPIVPLTAVPGAEGQAFSLGGRGGQVLFVTNLEEWLADLVKMT